MVGAIFGFAGPPERSILEGMSRTLQHRGDRLSEQIEHAWGSLACRFFAKQFERTEVHHNSNSAIAFSGFFTKGIKATNGPGGGFAAELLRRYHRSGISMVETLQGAYVMAIIDGEKLHLIRDGAGAKTIYYGRHQKRIFFSVEPKGIWTVPGFSRRLRPAAVARYLSFSFQPGTETMLENLYEVPAGTLISFNGGTTPKTKRYFQFEKPLPVDMDRNPGLETQRDSGFWVQAFRKNLAEAVNSRMVKREPQAAFLSGGIDSSVVVCELARQSATKINTFAVHFGKQYANELEFARMVADRCGTDHQEVLLTPKHFLTDLRKIIWYMDDPIGDPVTVPNFGLANRVSPSFTGIFNGEGGDPVFGGPKNLTMMLHHWYGGIDRQPGWFERAYLASYRRAYEEVSHLLTPQMQSQINPSVHLEGIITPFLEATEPKLLLHKLMAINIRLKGAHLILPKVERMLGAQGSEPLSPLFDERLIRLSFAMPPELVLRGGIEKVVLKEAYGDQLPEAILQRPKSGMRVPVHFWFQGEMKRYARHLLSPRQIKQGGIFNPKRIKQMLNYDIEEGRGRYGIRLWMLVTFEIWRRLVLEGESP